MKERLTEVDEEMERLASNERLSSNKVEELVDLLRLEVSRNDENGRAMECIEVGALCVIHLICCGIRAKWILCTAVLMR